MQALNGLELAGATIVVTCAAPASSVNAVAAAAAAAAGSVHQSADAGEIDDDGKTGLALNARDRVRLSAYFSLFVVEPNIPEMWTCSIFRVIPHELDVDVLVRRLR